MISGRRGLGGIRCDDEPRCGDEGTDGVRGERLGEGMSLVRARDLGVEGLSGSGKAAAP
jgi:hypothetical protein